jgi:hypothetical protein
MESKVLKYDFFSTIVERESLYFADNPNTYHVKIGGAGTEVQCVNLKQARQLHNLLSKCIGLSAY